MLERTTASEAPAFTIALTLSPGAQQVCAAWPGTQFVPLVLFQGGKWVAPSAQEPPELPGCFCCSRCAYCLRCSLRPLLPSAAGVPTPQTSTFFGSILILGLELPLNMGPFSRRGECCCAPPHKGQRWP